MLVLKNIENSGKKDKHGVNVLDISANGRGIDVVSSMTSPDNYLKEARLMAKESRNKDLVGGAAVPSSSLSADLHQQHHPAADFPKLNQVLDESINQPTTNASKNDTPQISAARELLQSMPDKSFSFENSLNPFLIRAVVLTNESINMAAAFIGLNPFLIRAVVLTT